MRQKQISYDRIDQEIAKTETRYPIVGLVLLLTTALLFWGGLWLVLRPHL